MLKQKNLFTLSFQLKSSRQLGALILLIHSQILICISLYSAHFLLKFLLISLILLHGCYVYRYYVSLSNRRSIRAVELNTRGEWWLSTARYSQQAQLLGNSLVTQYLMILNFKSYKFSLTQSVILMRDSISPEQWRKLRVYLETHSVETSLVTGPVM